MGVSTIAGYLMLLRVRESSDITNATKAIFASESGVQWEMYKQFSGKEVSNSQKPEMTNKTSFESSFADNKLKSIGESAKSLRAIELNFTPVSTNGEPVEPTEPVPPEEPSE